MKLINPPDAKLVEKAILQIFYNDFIEDKYLYLSVEDVGFEKKTAKVYEKLVEYCSYYKLQARASYRKRQKLIFDTLAKNISDTKIVGQCIYLDEVSVEEISSVSDYLAFLKTIPRPEVESFYRGQSNFKWKLLPSIYRELGWIKNEKLMIDKMMQSNPDEFDFSNTFDVLSKLQHYNLPTRLIDVTMNPLVALYFACNADFSEDAQVYIFSPQEAKIKYVDSDTVSVLANISKMDDSFGNKDILKKNTGRFIHFIRKEKPFFEDYLKPNCLDDYVFVRASYNNKRIAKQNGAFILVGVKNTKMFPAKITESFILNRKPTKILIPYSSKKDILKELELLSINEGTLFPEIDHVAMDIRKSMLY